MPRENCSIHSGSKMRKLRKHWLFKSTLTFMAMGYIFLAYWLLFGQFYKSSKEAYVSGTFVSISPQIQGHVTDILVKENDLVIKGQPIATIDQFNAYFTLKNAEDNLSASIKEVTEMYQTTYHLQSKAKADLATAQENLKKWQTLYKRQLDSYSKNNAVPIEKLKKSQIAIEKATDALEEANFANNAAMSLPTDFNLYQNPIVLEAMDKVRAAYLVWLNSTVYAPDTGYIIKQQISTGEAVNRHTILMTMTPLNQIWVNARLNEADLKKIHNGQHVKLTSTAYGNSVIYSGTVIGLSAQSDDPRKDNHIRIKINTEQLTKYPLRIGLAMSASVNIRDNSSKILTKIENPPVLTEVTDYHEELAQANQMINQIVLDTTKNSEVSNTQLGSL